MDGAEVQWEKVEKQRALALGGDGEQLAACVLRRLSVDVLKIGGLAAVPCAPVDNLAVNLTAGYIDERHLPSILKQIVYRVRDRVAEVDVDDLLFELCASAADALQHVLEILGGLARQNLNQPDVGLDIEDHHE